MSRRRVPRRPIAPRPREEDEAGEWIDRAHVDADFANRVLRGEELTRCTFDGCRMTGFQVPEGTLSDVRFTGCRIDLASLRYSSLERVVFQECVLRELDLVEARLQDVRFERCDLRLAEFGGARASRLALEGCDVDGLGGVDGLRGALVSWPDAMGLLGSLVDAAGLVVIGEDDED